VTLEHSFTVTRTLDAPRDLVFQAWTEPEHLRWFFADGVGEGETVEVDLRVGGTWRMLMVENATKCYWTGGVYREIVPDERLVFSWGAVDGWPALDPDHPEAGPLVTITLHDRGEQTELELRTDLPVHLSQDELAGWYDLGLHDGWSQTLDRLLISFRLPRVK
jgi:uncharacterized protein YndB with AHSA1/START domain